MSQLFAVSVDALDPARLAAFWQGLLGWSRVGSDLLVPDHDDTGFRLRFVVTSEPKTLQNLMHFDLTSGSVEEQERTVARVLELGGRHTDVGQLPEEEHVVMADPEGNELCVIEPGNSFLADCGFIGALACDGSHAVGTFWSAALGWPLVWDEGEETAIRSPHGGPKISWGGPPYQPRPPRPRWRFELVVDGAIAAEVERLVDLGATPLGQGVLADPDGNEFALRGAS